MKYALIAAGQGSRLVSEGGEGSLNRLYKWGGLLY